MIAADRLNRIVAMVAELSREPPDDGVPLTELAARYRTTPRQIQADIRALTLLGDHPEADWLSSLAVWQEGDRVFVSSQGPYRRPVRLLPEELLALRAALATEADGASLARRFGVVREGQGAAPPMAAAGLRAPDDLDALLRRAVAERRCVDIRYAGLDREPTRRRIEPHELLGWEGKLYCVAWCRAAGDWRHFRADRMLDAAPCDDTFTPRRRVTTTLDERPAFRLPESGADGVRVRFAAGIARWLLERYPDAMRQPDGSVIVTYDVASVDWLVRHVLQYGTEAEVLAPAGYRDALRDAVA